MAGSIFKSKTWKRGMGLLYGWGASVVIIGALFKINHYEGADIMLLIGLGMEAIIFFFSAFEPPFVEPDWSLVYPELAGMYHDHPDKKKSKKALDPKASATQQLDNMLEQAKVGPELIESLGKGLKNLSDNSNKLADISNASVATDQYVKNLGEASGAVNKLSLSYKKASEFLQKDFNANEEYLANIRTASLSAAKLADTYEATSKAIKNDGTAYSSTIHKVNDNLSALNSLYEIQLKGSEDQTKSVQKMQKGINSFLDNLDASVKVTDQYRKQVETLSDRVAALNTVYGNMLSAMNVKNK